MIQKYPRFNIPWMDGDQDGRPRTVAVPAVDDEFDSAVLDGKWTLTSSGSVSYDVNTTWPSHFYGMIDLQAAAYIRLDQNWAPSSYSLTAKFIGFLQLNAEVMYIDFFDADESDGVRAGVRTGSSSPYQVAGVYTLMASSTWGTATLLAINGRHDVWYIHHQRVGTTFSSWVSTNCLSWLLVASGAKTFTPHHFRLSLASSVTGQGISRRMGIDWVRANWLTLS